MSSEMREVDAFEAWARAQCFGEEELRRIEGRPANKFGLTWEYNGDSVQAAWAAWLERALLARTEAGADGRIDHHKAMQALEDLDDCARMDVGIAATGPYDLLRRYIMQQNRARPQDASGDAERYRWLRTALYSQNLDIGEAELSLRCYGAAPTLEQFDAAIDSAMQAKEAK